MVNSDNLTSQHTRQSSKYLTHLYSFTQSVPMESVLNVADLYLKTYVRSQEVQKILKNDSIVKTNISNL